MSTFDSEFKVDSAGMAALLAQDSLELIDIEDVLSGDDTQWEPVTQRRGSGFVFDTTGRHLSVHVSHFRVCDFDTLSTTWTKANGFYGGGDEAPGRRVQGLPTSHSSMAYKLVRDLGRLTNGWAGPDSIAPSADVLRDIQTVCSILPNSAGAPETEVDRDDGSVVLRWMGEGASRSFSLTFVGHGGVTGFYSADNSSIPAWKLKASDSIRLAIKFADDDVQTLLTR